MIYGKSVSQSFFLRIQVKQRKKQKQKQKKKKKELWKRAVAEENISSRI